MADGCDVTVLTWNPSRAALDLASVDLVVDAPKARKELGWKPRLLED